MSTPEVAVRDDGTWSLDAAAFCPKPEGSVKIGGVDYPIYSFLDVPIGDSLRVMSLGKEINEAKTHEDYLERSVEQIMILNAPADPEHRLTRRHFDALVPSQIIAVRVMAMSVAQVPLKAAAGSPSESPSPSPAPAGSTDGGPGSSSA